MSRHRKVKALDYDEAYDDYYGAFDEDDDDDDIDESAFEAKYLSSGIDLDDSTSNCTSIINNKQRQKLIDEVRLNVSRGSENLLVIENEQPSIKTKANESGNANNLIKTKVSETEKNQSIERDQNNQYDDVSTVTSDLAKFAIEHLDKHQWRLPLLEMDKKFRDKTYYKHYSDSYISSLRSKLGHFLADSQLISNPMKYHLQQELDNYMRYSRMFDLLTEYYHSLGGGFFSFATPSPDEEIVIGCRLGKKVKKPAIKQVQAHAQQDEAKVARFEYYGSKNPRKQQQPSSINRMTNKSGPIKETKKKDLTVQENNTAEQLENLSKQYKESMKIESKNKFSAAKSNTTTSDPLVSPDTSKCTNHQAAPSKTKTAESSASGTKKSTSSSALKTLETMAEKRRNLKQKLKRSAEPSAQDLEYFKKQALQTSKEYNELIKSGKNRPTVNLVVIGHVDAGKSTIIGHLLYKLGKISSKQMHRNEIDSQRYGKASFKYAWALDETEEERVRGVTIDIALTKFETPNKDIFLLDAPGHVDFIPAVISGAAQADAAILVIDATRGEFEMAFSVGGQTREHTFLVRSLGVKSLVVAVNKMDNVDWSYERFRDIVDQLKPFLRQVGFDPDKDVKFVVCSGLTGENLTERRVEKIRKQSSHPQLESDIQNYKSMPSLLEAIDKMSLPIRVVDRPTRVCVTDVFKGMSSGVFLGAKVLSGKIETKQKLVLMPPNEFCEIKQLEGRSGRETRAFAGDIITVVATGVDMEKYYRGCVLSDALIPCNATNNFVARIIMIQNAGTVLIKGTPIEVHINGTYECGEVRRLLSLLNKNTGELIQSRPRCIVQNSSALIQLCLSRVVCCELYENNKDLGRFMLRSCGKTIAAGLITKIKSVKLHKSSKIKSK